MTNQFFISDEQAMLDFGGKLAEICKPGAIIFLQGELGAGKTTLVRGFLRSLGYLGVVKSPTYTLVESYHFNHNHKLIVVVHHFDFYRVKHSQEIEEMGIRDYFTEQSICLIEWPENAKSFLPDPTLYYKIDVPKTGGGRIITEL